MHYGLWGFSLDESYINIKHAVCKPYLHMIVDIKSASNLYSKFLLLSHSKNTWLKLINRGFLKNRHACFELSHSIESSLRSLSTL